ncbi:hypothetical protein QE152_g36802 [Popillia japonica]|uniref:Uncharacterized protein n=1 Tax=Popillia japonica TaxID=7064 RepID=A0AAW1IBQ8_POPJA
MRGRRRRRVVDAGEWMDADGKLENLISEARRVQVRCKACSYDIKPQCTEVNVRKTEVVHDARYRRYTRWVAPIISKGMLRDEVEF